MQRIFKELKMNVAEAKRGMVRTEADEAGEEGKCQIMQAVHSQSR